MNHRAIALGVLLACATPLRLAAAESDLVAQLSAKLDVVDHWTDVPGSVRRALTQRWKSDAIAEPGASFQATDSVTPGRELPMRRLVFAAKSARHWFVCYERGGIAHVFELSVIPFADSHGGTAPVRTVMLQRPVQDLDSLRALVRAHAYRDTDFE